MTDGSRPVSISEGDLRRLYAKINAHEMVIRILIHAFVESADDSAKMFEQLRDIAMEEGDILQRMGDDQDAEFVDQGRIETLSFIAETFAAVKAGRGDQ